MRRVRPGTRRRLRTACTPTAPEFGRWAVRAGGPVMLPVGRTHGMLRCAHVQPGRESRGADAMADVVELIKTQHRRIEKLLQQAEESEPEQMPAVLRQVADLLLPHSEAEESFVYPA